MKNSRTVTRHLTMIMLFTSIGAMMISSLPHAAAESSPSVSEDPNVPVQGGIMEVIINAGVSNTLPHVKGEVRVYEPGVDPGTGTGIYSGSCNFGTTTGLGLGSAKIWEFRRADNPAATNEYTMTLTTDSLRIPFGFEGNPVTPTTTAGVTLLDDEGVWVQTSDSASPNTQDDALDILTAPGFEYTVSTCGYDAGGGPGNTGDYTINDPFGTQPLVAGTIIAIDATALLIGGFVSSPLMILPVLGIAAGVAFTLLKLQVERKL